MTDFKLKNYREGFHTSIETQLVTHAIYSLLGEPYEPILKGVQDVSVSSRIRALFRKFGIEKNITGDMGTCSCLLQDLVVYVCDNKALSPSRIETECQRLLATYPTEYVQAMNLAPREHQ